jgi:hypothetical protein
MADLSDFMVEGFRKEQERDRLTSAALRGIRDRWGSGGVLDDDEEPDTESTELQRADGQVRAAEAAIAEIQRAIERGSADISSDQLAALQQQLETATQNAADLRATADEVRRRLADAAALRQAERERRGAPRTNIRV